MNKYPKEFHITSEQAASLYGQALITHHCMGLDIARVYFKKDKGRDAEQFVYGVCFYAGIIEGKRLERERRGKHMGVSLPD